MLGQKTTKRKWNTYADKEWNPYTGCFNWQQNYSICRLGKDCWFYRMSLRLAGRFGYDESYPWLPTLHEDKLNQPLHRSKPTIYATCFMGDIGYCKTEWLDRILQVVEACPQHTFLFLTKMPIYLLKRKWPNNAWLGVSIEDFHDVLKIKQLKKAKAKHKWVSFEPLRGFIDADLEGIEGIAIGGKTGPHPQQPGNIHIGYLLGQARRYGCKVVLKDNLIDWYAQISHNELIVEWP